MIRHRDARFVMPGTMQNMMHVARERHRGSTVCGFVEASEFAMQGESVRRWLQQGFHAQ